MQIQAFYGDMAKQQKCKIKEEDHGKNTFRKNKD